MNIKTVDLIYAALLAALTAVLGFISITLPFSPVPISGSSLGIMITGSVLTVRQAGLSVLVYILIGAVGLPVFSGFSGGLGVVVGPRGGYYLGFLLGAMLIALLRGKVNNKWRMIVANLIGGILVVYFFGVLWLGFVTGMGVEKALVAGALPFIPGDIFKAVLASFIGLAVNRRLAFRPER